MNLTAADYAFIPDPWWNPSVEAQAIDRAHRIGQARQVFAYRLIASDTIEEKVALYPAVETIVNDFGGLNRHGFNGWKAPVPVLGRLQYVGHRHWRDFHA